MTQVDMGKRDSGTTHAYGLASGAHYLDMHANCDWRVTLTPI